MAARKRSLPSRPEPHLAAAAHGPRPGIARARSASSSTGRRRIRTGAGPGSWRRATAGAGRRPSSPDESRAARRRARGRASRVSTGRAGRGRSARGRLPAAGTARPTIGPTSRTLLPLPSGSIQRTRCAVGTRSISRAVHGFRTSGPLLSRTTLPTLFSGLRIEPVGQDDLRNAVRVDVAAIDVQRSRHVDGQHVPRPGRILEPRHLRRPFVDGDQVFLAVSVEVGRDELIAELDGFGDDVFFETWASHRPAECSCTKNDQDEASGRFRRNRTRIRPSNGTEVLNRDAGIIVSLLGRG